VKRKLVEDEESRKLKTVGGGRCLDRKVFPSKNKFIANRHGLAI